MAFGSLGGDSGLDTMADINVTPLVDVILVLLIIFMVTAPMLHQGIQVALPDSKTRNIDQTIENPLILSLTTERLIYVNETPIQPQLLEAQLGPMIAMRRDKTVFVKGDRDLPYGFVIGIMDKLHQMGIESIGMVTDASAVKPETRGASAAKRTKGKPK